MKQGKIESFGEILRKKRENNGITIKNVALLLNVSQEFLNDLENNNYKKLPNDVYLKGFIARYSKILKVNTNDLLKYYFYQKKIGVKKPKKKKTLKKFFITPDFFLGGVIFLSVFLIVLYFSYTFFNVDKNPSLELENFNNSLVVFGDIYRIKGRVKDGEILKINGETVPLDLNGAFSIDLGLTNGANFVSLKAENGLEKSFEKTLIINCKGR